MLDLIKDEAEFKASQLNHSRKISLQDCLERELLISPDTSKILTLNDDGTSLKNNDEEFLIQNGCPHLYPAKVSRNLIESKLPLKYGYDSLCQYVLLSQIKQSVDANASVNSVSAKRLHYRTSVACADMKGIILDIGCDKPSYSSLLFPAEAEYLGLDPYLGDGEFRIVGLGEILPIRTNSIDNVVFNTSLDHILDYHTAIEEAWRVLKINGKLVINTYAWVNKATLLTDTVHFHHFRENQILAALDKYRIEKVWRYECPKNDKHRYTLVIRASK